MNITIAGYGFVGQAHEAALKDKYSVVIHDPNLGYNASYTQTDAVIVCVSTPSNNDGSCDMKNVFDVIDQAPQVPILIKSTISLEGWQELKSRYPTHSITFSPEFLRAANAVEDFLSTREMYMGGDDVGFWHAIFRVAFNDDRFTTHHALAEELILSKYFRNSFLATKVAFFNQVYDLCTATGINYDIVKHVIAQDTRIGHSHTEVTPDRGFAGHCFPKDTSAIVKTAQHVNVELSLIQEAIAYNKRIRS